MNNEERQRKLRRIKELINLLNKASNNYYNSIPSMTDNEWDKLYDKLKSLENETHIIFPNSPTQNVGYKVLDEIEKVTHNHPMLSLDKCHSERELIDFANDKDCILSVKCDGLTTSLHYLNGILVSAESRGNGIEGGNVLENVKNIKNVPQTIPYTEELIIDGETIIDWDTFNNINDNLPKGQEKYKHPRNLVSGTLQLLDTKAAAERNMRFIAWRVIKGLNNKSTFFALKDAENLGFEIVPMWTYTNKSSDKENISKILEDLQIKADECGIPYDGAVMSYDSTEYAESLGTTEKFFKHSIAYKYEDELYETTLRNIEWQTSKTGLINPVAVFDEVDLDGALTTRATLHNLSYIKKLQLGIEDTITIYRANKVIPKVHDNLTRSGNVIIPEICPVCSGKTEIVRDNNSEVLTCTNPDCKGKLLGKLSHAVSKNALNIDGLSEATLAKLINFGWLSSIKDIYHLSDYQKQMKNLDGFGAKSVDKLFNAIEKSRNTTLDKLLYSLSIPLIGKTASKDIAKYCNYDITDFRNVVSLKPKMLVKEIDGFGETMCNSLTDWWRDNSVDFILLSEEFILQKVGEKTENNNIDKLKGLTFVITGSLINFANREELITAIESAGGKVTNSVTKKTNYLINNNKNSNSSKNTKAKELNIPIITEVELLAMLKK